MTKTSISTRKLVVAAMLAALTAVGSALRFTFPIDFGGTSSFHLGNILCALCGILLGPWMGGLAAGLGSAIYDMFNPLYISECWLTFLMKGAYGLAAGFAIRCGRKDWGYVRALVASIVGAVTYAVLYLAKSFFYSGMLLHGLTADAAWVTVISKLPATIFNAAIAIIAAPVLAITIRTALKRSHLRLE